MKTNKPMTYIKHYFLLWSVFIWGGVIAQYDDYIGAGHDIGVVVSASDEQQFFGWDEVAMAQSTINGAGMDDAFTSASRFLEQATLGSEPQHVQEVIEMGYEAWLDAQADIPTSEFRSTMDGIIIEALDIFVENGGDPEDFFSPAYHHFNYAWWQVNMTNDDLLRQRMAYALSQIIVISARGNLEEHVDGMADFYDLLSEHALGNYRDLLGEITLHPAMGVYLSHFNNPRTIEEENIRPDENFAREVMQLFSIGLYQLNMDGSEQMDGMGNPIPTYGIDEIKEFSKVFTGLGPGAVTDNEWEDTPYFGLSRYLTDFTEPMAMYPAWHEPGVKTLLNGETTNAGNTGMQDIEQALDNIFNHPNTAPFISRRLIQQLVKSNPTPSYVQRVADVFSDNGEGVRGDLFAVVKAILLDEEARTCAALSDPEHGKLREPLVRYTSFARMVDKWQEDERFWNTGYDFWMATDQAPLGALSVFNFYRPDFKPNGAIGTLDLFGPEYQIHNSRTSLSYVNQSFVWTNVWALMYSWDDVEPVFIQTSNLASMAKDPEVLIDHLDKHYVRGQMSQGLRENLRVTMEGMTPSELGIGFLDWRASTALYLVLISPEYAVLK